MADTAIGFEAPELDLSAGAGEQPDLEAGGEGEQPEAGAEGEQPEGGEQPEPGKPFLAVKDGKLSAEAKATIEKLKAENPQLAKAVQRALFAEDRLRKELPGGFKDLAGLRDKIEALGGDEGIQSLQGELNGWKEFDEQYTAGDPKVLEFLTQTPEAQEAFLKIAPAAFEKFREANPDGYSAYVSQVFAADMQEQGVPLMMQRLQDFIADKPQAVEIWNKLAAYFNRIGDYARKPVTAPATAPKGADPRAAELDTREQSLRRQEWKGEADQQHGRIFSDAWKRLAANVPPEKAALVRRLYGIHLQEKLTAKKDFTPNMDRYLKAKQKDGFMRLHESTFKDAVPLALRSAIAEAGIGARKAPTAAPKPGTPAAPGAPAKPAAGFTPVAAKPSMGEVNNVMTTPAMWQNRQAVLKNGKRVTWG